MSTGDVVSERQFEDAEARVERVGLREAAQYLQGVQPHLHAFIAGQAIQASARLRRLGVRERVALAVEDMIEKTALVVADALRPLLARPAPGAADAAGEPGSATPSSDVSRETPSDVAADSSTSGDAFGGEIEADHVRFLRSAIGVTPTPTHARMVVLRLRRKEGLEDLALRQPQAMRLLKSLARTLADEGHAAALRAAEAIVATEKQRETRPAEDLSPPGGSPREWSLPESRGHSDQLVHRELLLHSRMRVRVAGPQQALSELAQAEPAMARFIVADLLPSLSPSLDGTAAANCAWEMERQAVIGALALVMAIRRAYANLWADTMVGSRLAQVDPSLEEGGGPRPAQE